MNTYSHENPIKTDKHGHFIIGPSVLHQLAKHDDLIDALSYSILYFDEHKASGIQTGGKRKRRRLT